MARSESSTISLTAVALLVLLQISVARADTASMAVSCGNDLACKHNEQAMELYSQRHYSEALSEFQAAYLLRPEPALLINLGRCQHQLGRYREALITYQQYRQATPAPDAASQQKLHRYIDEAQTALRRQEASPGASIERRPLYKAWWLWTISGLVVAGSLGIGLGLGLTPAPHQTATWIAR